MSILRIVSLVIVCLALFAFEISAPAKAAPDAPFVDAVVQDCTEAKFNEALAVVQASAGGTLTFLQSCPAIIFTSEKVILKNVTIDGGNKIALGGSNTTRHFSLDENSRLTLKNIILTRGHAVNSTGGSVWLGFSAALFTDNVILEFNHADREGSAIYGYGDAAITLNSTTVQSNTANDDTFGYGAINSSGSLTITNSLLRENKSAVYGGAISANGKVLIENTTLSGNTAREGMAIYYTGAAGLTLSHSSVSNHTGIAIYNVTTMTILGSTISNNDIGLLTSPIDVTQNGAATLINTTFSNNTFSIYVGGHGSASLQHATIFGSRQEGIIIPQPASLYLIDVVIQQPTNPPAGSKNCDFQPQSVVTSHGYNLSNDTSCIGYLNKASDRNGVASGLGTLANNGGPTLTHLPQTGSPLIDGGICTNGISTDQRGFTRPSGAACDIGAVEVQLPNSIVPRARIPIVVK